MQRRERPWLRVTTEATRQGKGDQRERRVRLGEGISPRSSTEGSSHGDQKWRGVVIGDPRVRVPDKESISRREAY